MDIANITLKEIISGIEPVSKDWFKKVKERTSELAIPTRDLGRLYDIS